MAEETTQPNIIVRAFRGVKRAFGSVFGGMAEVNYAMERPVDRAVFGDVAVQKEDEAIASLKEGKFAESYGKRFEATGERVKSTLSIGAR